MQDWKMADKNCRANLALHFRPSFSSLAFSGTAFLAHSFGPNP